VSFEYRANKEEYKPEGFAYGGNKIHKPERDVEASYMEYGTETGYTEHEPIGFNRNVEQTGEYTPLPHFLTPTPTPCTRDVPPPEPNRSCDHIENPHIPADIPQCVLQW
jgi:hypothetical protein